MLYIWDWHYCVLVSFNQSAYCSLIGGLTNQKFYYQLIGLVHTFTDLNTSINFVLRIKCKTGGKKKVQKHASSELLTPLILSRGNEISHLSTRQTDSGKETHSIVLVTRVKKNIVHLKYWTSNLNLEAIIHMKYHKSNTKKIKLVICANELGVSAVFQQSRFT